MAYSKTNWLDRVVQFPRRFKKSGESAVEVTLEADPGTITQAGTPISAANLNKIETGVFDAHTNAATAQAAANSAQNTANAALPRAGGSMTGQINMSPSQGAIASQTDFAKVGAVVHAAGGVNDAAFIGLHRPGSFAAMIGIDIDNKWKVGGYSMGAVAHELWHNGRLRENSTGQLEFLTGGAWRVVGGVGIVASENVRESFDTLRVANSVAQHSLVAKHMPKGVGEIKIYFDLYRHPSGSYPFLKLLASSSTRRYTAIGLDPAHTFPAPDTVTWQTPLETLLPSNISSAQLLSLGGGSDIAMGTWKTYSVTLVVTEAIPIYIVMQNFSQAVETGYCRNIRFCYDII